MKRFLSVLLCLLLFFSLSFTVHAADMIHGEVRRMGEVIEKRETNSQTYKLSDGSYECVVYAEDKYFESQSGDLIEIDNSVIESRCARNGKEYAFSNAASDTVFRFSENEPSIRIEAANGNLAYSMVDSNRSFAKIGGNSAYQKLFEYQLSGKNCISYPSVQPQTDLVYSANNGTLKEYILLLGAEAPTEFRFDFDARDYIVRMSKNGTVQFNNTKNETVFELGKLFAVDAGGEYTEALRYSITGLKNNKIEITVSLSKEYLHAPERVFPVLIDPTITVTGASSTYDSFVASKYPTSNYYMSTSLCTGKDTSFGTRRTYIKFNMPQNLPHDSVTGAYINIRKNVGSAPSLYAYRVTGSWSSSSVTWNNQPTYASSAFGSSTAASNNWYRIYITNQTKQWLSGAQPNYGVLLRDANENSTSQWTSFYSSDASSPNKPELVINYTFYPGSRPYQVAPAGAYANCMSYALEYVIFKDGQYGGFIDPLGNLCANNSLSVDGFLNAAKQLIEARMNKDLGSFGYESIDSYNAPIESNQFRVVFRIGFEDNDGDYQKDANELWGMHWMYQSNLNGGDWADKPGTTASRVPYVLSTDPGSIIWTSPLSNYIYTSDCIYYAIFDANEYDWENIANNYVNPNTNIIRRERV